MTSAYVFHISLAEKQLALVSLEEASVACDMTMDLFLLHEETLAGEQEIANIAGLFVKVI